MASRKYLPGQIVGIWEINGFVAADSTGGQPRSVYELTCTRCGTRHERRQDRISAQSTSCVVCVNKSDVQAEMLRDGGYMTNRRAREIAWSCGWGCRW